MPALHVENRSTEQLDRASREIRNRLNQLQDLFKQAAGVAGRIAQAGVSELLADRAKTKEGLRTAAEDLFRVAIERSNLAGALKQLKEPEKPEPTRPRKGTPRSSGKRGAPKRERTKSPEELSDEGRKIAERKDQLAAGIRTTLSDLSADYPETNNLTKVILLVAVCAKLEADELLLNLLVETAIELDHESGAVSNWPRIFGNIVNNYTEHLERLGAQAIEQLETLSGEIKATWQTPSRFGATQDEARSRLAELATATCQTLEDFSQACHAIPRGHTSLAGQLLHAAGLLAQQKGSESAELVRAISASSYSETQWQEALESLQDIDPISGVALTEILSSLGRTEQVRSQDVPPAPTSPSFKTFVREALGDTEATDTMIYEVLHRIGYDEKAIEEMIATESLLSSALGSDEAAQAFLRIRPALVSDYVSDPEEFKRYCKQLHHHGPVMAAMHQQGVLSVHDFTSAEAIQRLHDRELASSAPTVTPAPTPALPLHEEAIQILRTLGVSAPTFTYAYLCHGCYKRHGVGIFVIQELRNKATERLFHPKHPRSKVIRNCEDNLVKLGVLKTQSSRNDRLAVARPDEIIGTSETHDQIRRLLTIAGLQLEAKARMPHLEPDWR